MTLLTKQKKHRGVKGKISQVHRQTYNKIVSQHMENLLKAKDNKVKK